MKRGFGLTKTYLYRRLCDSEMNMSLCGKRLSKIRSTMTRVAVVSLRAVLFKKEPH